MGIKVWMTPAAAERYNEGSKEAAWTVETTFATVEVTVHLTEMHCSLGDTVLIQKQQVTRVKLPTLTITKLNRAAFRRVALNPFIAPPIAMCGLMTWTGRKASSDALIVGKPAEVVGSHPYNGDTGIVRGIVDRGNAKYAKVQFTGYGRGMRIVEIAVVHLIQAKGTSVR
ncbi:hypothetical protein ABEW34_07605 [Paenibacillus algorifonticola]|uniref:hypothetical protein n=1 Tax=Paenibacillus algorifonticola TaxID=684063 RepID=UPI003D2BCDB2